MRSPYATRTRRRSRPPPGCLLLAVGAVVLLALIGSRTARNWGVPSFAPTPTATIIPPIPTEPAPPTPFSTEPEPPPSTLPAAPDTPAPLPISDAPAPVTPLDTYRQWIHEAREQYPYADSEERMMAVLLCESSGDPAIVSPDGANHGLFQYNAATWAGDWNPYRDQSLYDAHAQIFATACAWSLGMQTQWGCYTNPPR
jgi:hypothetical protein